LNTFWSIIGSGVFISGIALVGSVTLLQLLRDTSQRQLLPFPVAFALRPVACRGRGRVATVIRQRSWSHMARDWLI
jgi:hypothetical protein